MNFTLIVEAVSLVQFLIVGVFLLSNRRGNRTANILLAFFLISKAVCFTGDFLYYNQYLYRNLPFIFICTSSFDLLLGPPLYLYVKSLMNKDFVLTKYQLFHILPFFIYIAFSGFLFLIFKGIELQQYWNNFSLNFILTTIIYLHFIIYSTLCLITLKNYEKKLKTRFSSIEEKKMAWLFFLITGFIVIWLSAYINFILENLGKSPVIPWEIIISFIFIFANAIVYKGLKQPELFSGFISEEKNAVQKYAKTALPEKRKDEYLEKILFYMQNDRPFLNPLLTLDEFSEKTSIPSHYISQVLNTNLNQNFYDFINSYRIEESKNYLKNNHKVTVLEVLYDAGFNSKASFNRAFKKCTGMTPSEYRKTCSVQ